MVLEVFSFHALTLNGNPPPHLGIANLRNMMKMMKNSRSGHTSVSNCARRDFSLNFTSTMTLPVMEIPKSPNDVPSGFLVS